MSHDAPAHPRAILRGHRAPVHVAAFVQRDYRLATGDADGFVVLWDLTIMRPCAVWKAHTNAILGIASWGRDRIITHGRDNKLVVWSMSPDDEASLSTTLPLEPTTEQRQQPWILHILEVNTMNFCSFSSCTFQTEHSSVAEELLMAVPNTLASEAVDIYHLPSQHRQHTISLGKNNGMVMALSLFYLDNMLTLVACYENGLAIVAQLSHLVPGQEWVIIYQKQAHSQPVLSLDIMPGKESFITSSADSLVIKHPIPKASLNPRVIGETSREKETSLSKVETHDTEDIRNKSAVSVLLTADKEHQSSRPKRTTVSHEVVTEPLKTVNTKHSGQQSLAIRSDGKIFATAGWDARLRVYSAKTLKEVAVLKWHQVGCYAVAFSDIGAASADSVSYQPMQLVGRNPERSVEKQEQQDYVKSIAPKPVDLSVKDQRIQHAKTAHWLAAGSKDGKVSLWDIF